MYVLGSPTYAVLHRIIDIVNIEASGIVGAAYIIKCQASIFIICVYQQHVKDVWVEQS